MPLTISIIIPSYNRAAIIGKTIDSFITQDYKHWEMFVVDDHSTDNTKEVIERYQKVDSRIHYLLNERKKGAQGARNTGILHSNSEMVLLFDSDNIAHSDMLQELVGGLRPGIDVVSCFSNVIDINSNCKVETFEWINEGNIHKNLFSWLSYVDFNQAIVKKSKLVDIGLLDEDCPSMQEWDTHIRLSKSAIYTTIKKPLLDYYVNGDDTITSDSRREVKGYMYVLKKHQQEWKEDVNDLNWMINRLYFKIRMVDDIMFRIKYIIKLSTIAPITLKIVSKYRVDYLKRKLRVL